MTYLDDLLAATRSRIDELKQKLTESVLEQRVAAAEPPRGFRGALQGPDVAIIAEIKRATPRAGTLAPDLDAGQTAATYEEGGAAALSVLTEPSFFKGSLEDLEAARSVSIPVLRKDFILHPMQVYESRAVGADAVLLIVRILGDELGQLHSLAHSLGMSALVEVHTEEDLERALSVNADLIGVNHRDLETFEIDPDRTRKLAPRLPSGVVLVALSGTSTREEIETLADAGADAVLIGEALVTATDPVAKLHELLAR
jgi:indole-3-glycerol phosphate synthase